MLIICKQECLDVYLNSTNVQISCYKRVDNRLSKKIAQRRLLLGFSIFFRRTCNSERNPNQMQRTSTQQKAAVLLSKAS